MKPAGCIALLAVAAATSLSMGCNATKLSKCKSDLTSCQAIPKGQLARTRQTGCFDVAGSSIACTGTGQDGALHNGLAPQFVVNGDGTISDLNTGLMWEQKSDDGGIHDRDNTYTWADAFSVFIPALNNGGGFAGHSDWRVPQLKELQSLATYDFSLGCQKPWVDSVFDTNCSPGCTVTACSCSASGAWSSTTAGDPSGFAWSAGFSCNSGSGANPKASSMGVRAVRGGP